MIQDFGRYNILLKLGQGGMGAVYLARHKTLKRFCVIKVISPQLAHDPEISERLLREARAAASLSHPHLVNVFDCDRYEGQYFIAMEYVEGVTIIEAIRNFQFFPLPFALHCLYQAAKGLEYIHGRGIIHRDIKPDNMIIDHRGTVKIMDLGLAKDRIEDVSLTTTGTVMGSPYYISPEQIEDIKSVDGRSDLYSLGISFYQMLMGQVPFSGPTAAKIFISHLNDPVPPVNAGSEELNAGLNQIIARLTAKKKEDRYPDAAALVQELEPWITAYPVHLSTNSFFANLGFENHAIAFLLEREGLKGVNVDADYPSLSSPEDILKTRVGEKKPTAPLFSAPSSSPALSYSFPNETQADFQPPVKSNAGKWALISGALVLSLIAAVFFIKTNQKSGSDELGRIEITAEPESSKITVAGNALSSPAKFDKVTPGTHTLEITAEGHKKLTKPVEIKPGPNPPLHFVLPKSRGWASIESIPPGAAIVQNNTLLGNTPFRVEGNPGESNEYVLKLVGYQDAHVSVMLKEDGEKKEVELKTMVEEPAPLASANPAPPLPPRLAIQIERLVDRARRAGSNDWTSGKQPILMTIGQTMREKNSDSDEVTDSLQKISATLEECREMDVNEFRQNRERIVNSITENIRKGMGK